MLTLYVDCFFCKCIYLQKETCFKAETKGEQKKDKIGTKVDLQLFRQKNHAECADCFAEIKKKTTFAAGKSYTAGSLRIPQGLTAARVVGCSGAI